MVRSDLSLRGTLHMQDQWFTDHPPSTRFPHYTRANAGEVLPTPASPLGQTFAFDQAILPGFQEGSCRMGAYEAADYRDGAPEICGFFGAHFYVNLSNVRMQAVRNPAITVDQLDLAIFGANSETPPYEPHPEDDKPHLLPEAERHMGFVLSATEWPQQLVDKAEAAAIRADRPDLTTMSDAELTAHVSALLPDLRRFCDIHMVAAGSSGIAPGMLAAVGEAVGDPTIPMRLLSGMGGVDSAAPSFAMWEISRLVRHSPELTAAFDAGINSVLGAVAASDSSDAAAFTEAFDSFVFEYGSRGPNEWELSASTWETDPTIALAALNNVRRQDDAKSPTAGQARLAAERDQLIGELRVKLTELDNEELAATFEGALIGGNMMVYRERGKTTVVRVLHEIRMAFRELGRRHAEAGNLASADQIFMLTADELDGFVADPAGQTKRLAERAAEWDELWELEPPFFISNGYVPPLTSWDRKGASGAAIVVPDEVLTGVPGSPGVVTGRARIVLDPTDPPELLPGDIMVAPLTDPAWTPLFMAADAIVVNVGGQISHAVIVSRELGMPCAVSVTDASDRIPDGATIEVNGGTGEVRILSLP